MSGDVMTTVLIAVTGCVFVVLGLLFVLLAAYGRLLTPKDDRTPLGNALGHVCGSMGVMLWMIAVFFIARAFNTTGTQTVIHPMWLDTTLRFVLLGSAVWCFVSALVCFPYLLNLLRRRRRDDDQRRRDEAQRVYVEGRQGVQDTRQTAQDSRQTAQDTRQGVQDDYDRERS